MVKISLETLKSKHVLAGYCATLVCALEAFAIVNGINGVALTIAVAFIGGLGGYYGGKKQPEPEA